MLRNTRHHCTGTSGQILRHQYGISVAEAQKSFLQKRPRKGAGRGARRDWILRIGISVPGFSADVCGHLLKRKDQANCS